MLCFEVGLDGTDTVVVGRPGMGTLWISLEAAPGEGEAVCQLTSEAPTGDEQDDILSWGSYTCGIGTEIRIRLIESESPDAPVVLRYGEGQVAGGPPQAHVCSFCGRVPIEIEHLVGGRNASICNVCLDDVVAMMRDDEDSK